MMSSFIILAVPSQVRRAFLDAYAPVLVSVEIHRLKDPIRGPSPTLLPQGTRARVRCVYYKYRGDSYYII